MSLITFFGLLYGLHLSSPTVPIWIAALLSLSLLLSFSLLFLHMIESLVIRPQPLSNPQFLILIVVLEILLLTPSLPRPQCWVTLSLITSLAAMLQAWRRRPLQCLVAALALLIPLLFTAALHLLYPPHLIPRVHHQVNSSLRAWVKPLLLLAIQVVFLRQLVAIKLLQERPLMRPLLQELQPLLQTIAPLARRLPKPLL